MEEVGPETQPSEEADGPDADEGHKPKKRASRTDDEKDVLKSLPSLEHYRVLSLQYGKSCSIRFWRSLLQ